MNINEYKELLKKHQITEIFNIIAIACINKEIQGCFILKNGNKIYSNQLQLNDSPITQEDYRYRIKNIGTYTNKGTSYKYEECEYDIIDFILSQKNNMLET